MNLQKALSNYLSLRRSLGFKLHTDGVALMSFVTFMEKCNSEFITTEQAICWAKMTSSNNPVYWGRRLCFVRGFARYLIAFDNRTEILPLGLFPSRQRSTPYLFTDIEIRRLIKAAGQLPYVDPLLGLSLPCLLGLLSVTGLRISEALNLTADHIDLESGLLTITGTKFGKTRLIPLHPSTRNVLLQYQVARQQLLNMTPMGCWFVNQHGKRLKYGRVNYYFRKLLIQLNIGSIAGCPRPHLHGLRHHFAISTLIRWYQEDLNVEAKLPVLSAFLGHVETRDTYWYISAYPNLMQAAKNRLEKHWEVKG